MVHAPPPPLPAVVSLHGAELVATYAAWVLVLSAVFVLLRRYAASEVGWLERAVVAYSWITSLSVVALVPLDVAACVRGERVSGLGALWGWAYWSTFSLTWAVVPLHQGYVDAGDFTRLGRLRTSIKENLILYALCAVLGVIAILFLLSYGRLDAASLGGFLVALSNAFGITTGLVLVGYGLVEVPKTLWRSGDLARSSKAAVLKVGYASDRLDKAFAEMCKTATVIRNVGTSAPPSGYTHSWALRKVMAEVPACATGHVGEDETEDDLDYDYEELSDIAALRRRLQRAVNAYRRATGAYEGAVLAAVEAADAAASAALRPKRFRSTIRPGTGDFNAMMQWWWKCALRPWLFRATAVVLAIMSAGVVVAEATIWLSDQDDDDPDLSLFSMIIRAAARGYATLVPMEILIAMPLVYIMACAYFSLFRLGMFSFYSLIPKNTDAGSLLLNCSLTCRFSAPLCWNFLSLVPVVHKGGELTTFEVTMGASTIPHVFDQYNRLVPLTLVIYCGAIAFNAYNRITQFCMWGSSRGDDVAFADEGEGGDAEAENATRILQSEEDCLERALAIGSTNPSFHRLHEGSPGIGTDEEAASGDRVGLLSGRRGSGSESDLSRGRGSGGGGARAVGSFAGAKDRLRAAVEQTSGGGGEGGSRGAGRGTPSRMSLTRPFLNRGSSDAPSAGVSLDNVFKSLR